MEGGVQPAPSAPLFGVTEQQDAWVCATLLRGSVATKSLVGKLAAPGEQHVVLSKVFPALSVLFCPSLQLLGASHRVISAFLRAVSASLVHSYAPLSHTTRPSFLIQENAIAVYRVVSDGDLQLLSDQPGFGVVRDMCVCRNMQQAHHTNNAFSSADTTPSWSSGLLQV